MPELPEVEVTRRRIAPHLLGRRIRRLRTTRASYFFETPPARLRRALAERRATALERRGKYLLLALDDGARLLLHLGMTGQLFPEGASSLRLLSSSARAALTPERQRDFRPDAHTHLRFEFDDDGPQVYFRDVRKFGKVLWLAPGAEHPRLEKLGSDALDADGAALFAATRKRRVAIKSLLLDQSVLAGVGNIYADEALFRAGVRPTRAAFRVKRRECDAIADGVRCVLQRSIDTGGSSISDFVAPDGRDGRFQDERQVYARAGAPCRVCGTPIVRCVVGQRGTHYCRRCQG